MPPGRPTARWSRFRKTDKHSHKCPDGPQKRRLSGMPRAVVTGFDEGFRLRFHWRMNAAIASIKSGTHSKLPRRTALPVSSANQRSTMFIQLELVGMKCILKRG